MTFGYALLLDIAVSSRFHIACVRCVWMKQVCHQCSWFNDM